MTADLARLAARGALWGIAATVGARLVTVVSLAVLARLLAPAEFGLLAFALVVVTYLETVGDLGTGLALIQRRGDDVDAAADATFAVNLATGVFWMAVTWLTAPFVADFFGDPRGTGVLRVIALGFPLKALGATHDALCQRALRFRARAVPEVAMAAVKAVVSIALATQGYGAWGLAWGQVAGTLVSTALLWRIVPWRPRRRVDRAVLAPLLAFGRGIVAVNVIAAVVHHADLVVVGRVLGTTALGLYQVASRVPDMTITVVLWAVGRALFPALSRVRPDHLGPAFTTALRYVALVTLPASAGLALLAEVVVHALFGPRWSAAAPILRGLAIYAGLRSLGTHAGDLLKATGRPGRLALLGLARAALLVPALAIGLAWGAPGVAAAMAVTAAVMLAVNLAVATRLSGSTPAQVAEALGPAAVATAAMAAAVSVLLPVLDAAPAAVTLAAATLVGAVVYGTVVWTLAPEVLREARTVLRAVPAQA